MPLFTSTLYQALFSHLRYFPLCLVSSKDPSWCCMGLVKHRLCAAALLATPTPPRLGGTTHGSPLYSYAAVGQLEESVGYIENEQCLQNATLQRPLVCPPGQQDRTACLLTSWQTTAKSLVSNAHRCAPLPAVLVLRLSLV